jgi:GNAT superfamily N-acetyltransferase
MDGRRQIELVNHDDAGVAAWYGVLSASFLDQDPTYPFPRLPEMVAQARDRADALGAECWLLRVDDQPAGAYRFLLPLLDNLDYVEMHLGVAPGWQHQGHGRALLDHALARAAELGRHQVVGETDEPPDGKPSRGMGFATAAGFVRSLGEVRRVLDLQSLDHDRLDRLRAEAAAAAVGYQVLGWSGSCPDDLVDGYAALIARLSTDAPSGGLDLEPEVWDAQRVRGREALLTAQGRYTYASVARRLHDGALVAFTDLLTKVHDPDNVFQDGTLVVREERGHRLGLLVKLANLDRLRAAAPDALRMHTSNADTNVWMAAVNDAMGFRVAGQEAAWRLDLPRD